MMGGMKDFLFQYTPRNGENLIARPVNDRFAIPIAQLPNQSFIVPNDPEICVLELYTARPSAYYRTPARRLGRALCWAGIPVFDERGRIKVYCPRPGARVVWEALHLRRECLSNEAEALRNYAELGDPGAVLNVIGGIEYKLLDSNIIVIEGLWYPDTVLVQDERRYYLPDGAILL